MLPDIVGFTLEEAQKRLESAGIRIDKIEVTAPPRQKSAEYDRYYRVIRVKYIDVNSAELLVCRPL